MKTNLIYSLIIMLFPVNLYAGSAKDVSIKWGSELEGSKRGTVNSLLGHDESGFYVTGYLKFDFYIQKIDKNLNDLGKYMFIEKDPVSKTKYSYVGSRFFNDRLLVFKSVTTKSEKSSELYVQEINKSSMQEVGNPRKICEYNYSSSRDKGGFNIYTTKDETSESIRKMMIVFEGSTIKGGNQNFFVTMMDSDLQVLWSKKLEIPYPDELFTNARFTCDKNGNAYILGRAYKDKVKDEVKGKQNYNYHLFSFTDEGTNSVDYEIELQDKFITDISYSIADNGDIVAGGFYSRRGTYSVDGSYYLLLDAKSKDIKKARFKEFDLNFIMEGMSAKEEAKTKKAADKGKEIELYQYDLHDLIRRSDGGIVLVGEQYFVRIVRISNGKTTSTNYHYNYNNIIVINIDPDGNIEWAQKIPKRQVSVNDDGRYSSYALAVTDQDIRIVYNDNKANLQPKKQGELTNFTGRSKDSIVTLCTITKDGKLSREEMIKGVELEVWVRPKVCEQISDNEMLLFGERGKTDQFAIVKFNK